MRRTVLYTGTGTGTGTGTTAEHLHLRLRCLHDCACIYWPRCRVYVAVLQVLTRVVRSRSARDVRSIRSLTGHRRGPRALLASRACCVECQCDACIRFSTFGLIDIRETPAMTHGHTGAPARVPRSQARG